MRTKKETQAILHKVFDFGYKPTPCEQRSLHDYFPTKKDFEKYEKSIGEIKYKRSEIIQKLRLSKN